jgi:S-adenosylmethionine-diacylglycerol 3-amino-3-carboxypropyl transferase
MSAHNLVQFAVVREDPMIEVELLRARSRGSALLIASGGCTALTLRAFYPELDICLFDFNPHQLEHVRKKCAALSESQLDKFNIENDDALGLNACGNFESLFRGLRNHIWEFVADKEKWMSFFESRLDSKAFLEETFRNKYWSAGFEMFFSDPLLLAMFGEAAIQHAPRGSYPVYFKGVFERGLLRQDAPQNYFLHHLLIGSYLKPYVPVYLSQLPKSFEFRFSLGQLGGVCDLSRYDLVSLSNIFDWSSEDQVQAMANQLMREMKPGARVLFRQLNHQKDFRPLFGREFEFESALESRFLSEDRSLFYSQICIGTKKHG